MSSSEGGAERGLRSIRRDEDARRHANGSSAVRSREMEARWRGFQAAVDVCRMRPGGAMKRLLACLRRTRVRQRVVQGAAVACALLAGTNAAQAFDTRH